MKKNLILFALVLPILAGCMSSGQFYSEPVQVPHKSLKSGSSCSFLGLGKNHPMKAAQNGKLQKVISTENATYFGIFNCTYAYGE